MKFIKLFGIVGVFLLLLVGVLVGILKVGVILVFYVEILKLIKLDLKK